MIPYIYLLGIMGKFEKNILTSMLHMNLSLSRDFI
jgi:hypothetical protein